MERITLSTAFVLPSGPETSHLCMFLSIIALEGLIGGRVPDNVRNTQTLAFLSTTTALDTHASNAGIRTETILLLPVSFKDIILGDEATTITYELRLADDIAVGIFGDNVRKATTGVHPACQGLFMCREDILDTIFLSEALG